MTNHPETPVIEALERRIFYHPNETIQLDHPSDTIKNLVVNGMLAAIISILSSTLIFGSSGYEQRGRWIFILASILIGMFVLFPIRRTWSRWRIRALKAKIHIIEHGEPTITPPKNLKTGKP